MPETMGPNEAEFTLQQVDDVAAKVDAERRLIPGLGAHGDNKSRDAARRKTERAQKLAGFVPTLGFEPASPPAPKPPLSREEQISRARQMKMLVDRAIADRNARRRTA